MPIFGQVWLWSLAAFLLGALLCWVLVVLPVRRRIDALESRLSALRADAKVAGAERARSGDRPSDAGLVPGFATPADEIRSDALTRAYALPGVADSPPPYQGDADPAQRGALSLSTGLGAPAEPRPGDLDWFDAQQAGSAPDKRLVDDSDSEERGTIFTQRTTPIPAELIRRIDEDSRPEPPAAEAPRPEDSLVDDLADEPEPGPRHQLVTPVPEPETPEPPKLPSRRDRLATRTEPEPVAEPEPPAATLDTVLVAPNGGSPTQSDVDTPAVAEQPPAAPEPEVRQSRRAAPEPEVLPTRRAAPEPEVLPTRRAAPEPEVLPTRRAAPEPEVRPSRPAVAEPEVRPARRAAAEPEVRPSRRAVAEPEERSSRRAAAQPAAELSSRAAFIEPKVDSDRPSALPKRIPSKPQHRHPFGVATVSTPVAPSAQQGGERLRSLFEPIIPVEGGEEDVPPPPNRLPVRTPGAATGSRPSSPGPFGPGSAMPLPGGASPSPEFTVKASVTALRYCTPESPQFGRTIAEVWFRSAADAERVGFRPVG